MKRNFAKKLISVFVAICLIATFVPLSFASETESDALVYSFMASDYGISGTPTNNATSISYAVGNGNLAYYGTDTTSATTNDWNQKWDGVDFSARFQLERGWGKTISGTTYYHYSAFTIKGIESYEYNVTFDYALHTAGAEKANVYILNPKQTADILSGSKTVASVINDDNVTPIFSGVNMKASAKGKSSAASTFTPDSTGEHLLVFTRTDYGSTKNIFPQKLTFEPIKAKGASFSFGSPTVVTTTEKSDEYYFSETKASSSAASKPGYLSFADDMYITSSSSVQQLRLPNVNVYSSTDASTSLGTYGRYSLVYDNWSHFQTYGCLSVKCRLDSDGIYKISVNSGANSQGGLIAVYANGIHIGNIADYKNTFSANSSAMAVGKAELHTTELKAVKLLRDDRGYIELTFKAISGEGTDRTNGTADRVDFIPLSFDFQNAEVSDIAEPETVLNTTVAASVMNGVGGTVSETPVNSGAAGRSVTYTALPDDGYVFSCWTDRDGKVLSEESAYTFDAYTNMSIYANFDKKDAVGVKFYNGNGEFLGFVEKESGALFSEYKSEAPTPEYGGARFDGWSIDDETEISGIAYAIAQFTDSSDKTVDAIIKVNGNPSRNGNLPIGDAIECHHEEATTWYRDGKYVAYGEGYTHYIFKDANISSDNNAPANKAPVAILDDLGNGSYMLEYDGGDYTILAAGVIFGNSKAIKISSCYANAKARNIGLNHGQFTAFANGSGDLSKQSVARGYVIYSEGGELKVIYGDLDS